MPSTIEASQTCPTTRDERAPAELRGDETAPSRHRRYADQVSESSAQVLTFRAYARLLPLATLDGEVHDQNVVRDEAGVVTSAELVWMNRSCRASPPATRGRATASLQATVLGMLSLADGRLSAEVNSVKRAAALQRLVARQLGPDVTLVHRGVSDIVAEAFAQAKSKTRKCLHLVEPPRVVEPELAAIEAEVRARYRQEWLDTPVPALKGKTPRQAARSASGRERLEALLAGLALGPADRHDDEIAFLRTALKLPPLHRRD